jgi:hypothetical protein
LLDRLTANVLHNYKVVDPVVFDDSIECGGGGGRKWHGQRGKGGERRKVSLDATWHQGTRDACREREGGRKRT